MQTAPSRCCPGCTRPPNTDCACSRTVQTLKAVQKDIIWYSTLRTVQCSEAHSSSGVCCLHRAPTQRVRLLWNSANTKKQCKKISYGTVTGLHTQTERSRTLQTSNTAPENCSRTLLSSNTSEYCKHYKHCKCILYSTVHEVQSSVVKYSLLS